MRAKKEITLLGENKLKHSVNDQVELLVSIKNIKRISIKIYEINLKKYYLENQAAIQDEVDLSFLIPTHQDYYDSALSNPFQLKKAQLRLEKIPNKMGLFIVDLEGEGVISRAVIRKGQICCLDSLTEAGQKLSFFDNNGSPITGKHMLELWIRDQPVPLTASNYAFINYSPNY
jgi:hypothetical protein